MSGIIVTTANYGGLVADTETDSGQLFIAGLSDRGDTVAPILLRGMADVNILLGNRTSYAPAWDQLNTFFAEGGQKAWFKRVVGTTPTKGLLSLLDRAGSPVATVRIDAASAGDWSSTLKVQVRDGSAANTFRITVYLADVIVEDFTNITSPADAVIRLVNSPYVKAVNLGSATVAPNNNPAVLAATSLSAGTADIGTVNATSYVTALGLFNKSLGDGAVAVPGQTGTTIWDGLIAHAQANNRIALLAAARGETVQGLISAAAAMTSEHAGLFAPWVTVTDGAYGTRVISPEGFVAALRAKAHYQKGPWRVPAGVMGIATSLYDIDQVFTTAEFDSLDISKVSIIKKVQNTIRLYGWNSLSANRTDYAFLKDRDLLNFLVVQAEQIMEDYIFAPIDSRDHLLGDIEAALEGLVMPIADAGGLYAIAGVREDGIDRDPGYRVDTGTTINTPASLALNQVNAQLLVRIAPAGSLISLTIVKVGIGSGLGESV